MGGYKFCSYLTEVKIRIHKLQRQNLQMELGGFLLLFPCTFWVRYVTSGQFIVQIQISFFSARGIARNQRINTSHASFDPFKLKAFLLITSFILKLRLN